MLLTRMLPRFSIVLPFYIIAISLGLFDTWFLLIVVYLSFNLPFTVWLLKGYIEELPVSIEDAALIDGCSSRKLFSSILLPLTRPMVIAVAVINFVFSWNEFFFAFILTSRRARTLQVMIPALAGTMDMDWPMMTAISSLTMIVPLLLVTLVQRHIVHGLTLGAIR